MRGGIMNLLEILNNMKFYEADDGDGDGAGAEDKNEDNKGDDGKEVEKPYKSFKEESDYLNTMKSERSKAKNELMKELGISSVDDAKTTFKKASDLEGEINTYKTKTSELEESLTLTKNGVKDDYADEALSLAKSKVGEDKDLATALGEVIKKFPMMASKAQQVESVGSDKGGEDKGQDDQGKVKSELKKKYPWLDL
jgi:hypothetical protein